MLAARTPDVGAGLVSPFPRAGAGRTRGEHASNHAYPVDEDAARNVRRVKAMKRKSTGMQYARALNGCNADLRTCALKAIRDALEAHGGNVTEAAVQLGITRRSLHRLIDLAKLQKHVREARAEADTSAPARA